MCFVSQINGVERIILMGLLLGHFMVIRSKDDEARLRTVLWEKWAQLIRKFASCGWVFLQFFVSEKDKNSY
jgi:hypothetical protein